MSTKEGMLEVRDLAVQYGAISAVKGISFGVHAGEIVTLIGANGAGKTSALNAISGTVSYTGTIFYKGQNLRGVPPHRIVAMGIAHVPEGRGIFGNLTVMENLRIAHGSAKTRPGSGMISSGSLSSFRA